MAQDEFRLFALDPEFRDLWCKGIEGGCGSRARAEARFGPRDRICCQEDGATTFTVP